MTKKQFYEDVTKMVAQILGDDVVVDLQEITKVNVSLEGLTIRKKNEAIAPTIYLNQYYAEHNEGRQLDDIVNDIIQVYRNNLPDNLESLISVSDFYDYDKMKDKIVLKVINEKRNEKLLEAIPNLKMEGLGLCVVFYLSLSATKEASAGILIKNEHLKLWNKTTSDLLSVAEINTNRMHAYIIKNLSEIIAEMMGIEEDILPDDVPALYVLTDENKSFGASQLYLKDKIREFAEAANTDVYILPSSVHELLLLRADAPNIEPAYLNEMVCNVNETEVKDEDFLYNGAFKFILSEDKIVAL